ncbi:MAG: bifunctional phosphoribosylaminoimidazolecarboxamide formyltransferase/IMP cyclohydrolase, partial [Muribaculaceae bacterium]|nr:bifunctional phosphoribosylaminoimidazolecarboxamide formyltransferase/IMP cyclohydrolase [Muribaculaceae bacterium]
MKALISVSDKRGIVEFATALSNLGWEIIATGGTMKTLRDAGITVINISDITGFPEICDGRVKTLHPKVHGALLGRRDLPDHMVQLEANGIGLIDMVCVNLYPFEATIAKEGVTMEDAVENIDIGGPSMLRSAAKNFSDVTVVCDPDDYAIVLDEIKSSGNTNPATRLRLSAKAYTHTAEYDSHIATYMRKQAGMPEKLFLNFDIVQTLRYGENPHQQAAFYRADKETPYSVAFARQLGGKELSYNNIQDANAALNIVREFEEPFCVGLKHMNPCGAAVGHDLKEAWLHAYEADKVSIYGGIVAMNRPLTAEVATLMKPIFLEIVMAPEFTPEALEVLASKKNLRLLEVKMDNSKKTSKQYVGVNGGLLVQDADVEIKPIVESMCVTERHPGEAELKDMNFGWKIVKHVKSNAICVVKNGMT